MAGETKTTTAGARRKAPAPKAADPRDGLSVAELARGILSKEIRSRAVDVQRLAEAVLDGAAKPNKAGKSAPKDAKADGKTKDKSKKKKKKKLAKIPGQHKK
jgi:hypothetical protein